MKTDLSPAEIIEGNKELAKFMGFIYQCTSPEKNRHYRLIHSKVKKTKRWAPWKPHSDWNDLMEIIYKFERNGVNVIIECDSCRLNPCPYENEDDPKAQLDTDKKTATWRRIVMALKDRNTFIFHVREVVDAYRNGHVIPALEN